MSSSNTIVCIVLHIIYICILVLTPKTLHTLQIVHLCVSLHCLAALKAKCSTDLDELLDFKVKQYGEGIVTACSVATTGDVVDVQAMEVTSDDYRLFNSISGYSACVCGWVGEVCVCTKFKLHLHILKFVCLCGCVDRHIDTWYNPIILIWFKVSSLLIGNCSSYTTVKQHCIYVKCLLDLLNQWWYMKKK